MLKKLLAPIDCTLHVQFWRMKHISIYLRADSVLEPCAEKLFNKNDNFLSRVVELIDPKLVRQL